MSKCEVMALGNGKREYLEYNGQAIQWVEKMKITGVTFSNDMIASMKSDFEFGLDKMRNQFNMWKARGFSLIGRIQII